MNTPRQPAAPSHSEWQAMAERLQPDPRPVLGGVRCATAAGASFDVVNPYTGRVLAAIPCCGAELAGQALRLARQTADSGDWPRRAPSERAQVLRKLADRIEAHGDELALLDSLQMGMPVAMARDDITLAARKLREVAATAERQHDALLPSVAGTWVANQRVPQGVVLAITPWNFPLFVALAKIGPALAMGNAVVLKPSEIAPLACLRLGDLAAEAGLPAGALSVLPGLGAELGGLLAQDPRIDMIAFTGSTATGRALMRASAASNLKALQLELGGKSPQVVLDDCGNIDALAQSLADGFAYNTGQVCVAGSRLLVARDLADALLPRVAQATRNWVIGDPLDPATTLGPLATRVQFDRVRGFLDDARAAGWREYANPTPCSGLQLAPTLFAGVPVEAALAQDEVFGPVAAASFIADDEDAIRLANASRYGLVATVWCSEMARGLTVAGRISAGGVTLNTHTAPLATRSIGASIEPVRESGFGVEGGVAGLLAYTRLRQLTVQFRA